MTAAKRTILLVDDDTDLRVSVAEALEDEGHQVLHAANGREALQQLKEGQRPDLILLDMMMPVMDGWQFRAEQQKLAELVAIPTVIFTAYNVPAGTTEQLNAAGILKKPLRLAQLLAVVESVGR
jgi:CheY-like chemotaxis protein